MNGCLGWGFMALKALRRAWHARRSREGHLSIAPVEHGDPEEPSSDLVAVFVLHFPGIRPGSGFPHQITPAPRATVLLFSWLRGISKQPVQRTKARDPNAAEASSPADGAGAELHSGQAVLQTRRSWQERRLHVVTVEKWCQAHAA